MKKPRRILILGGSGQLGRELQRTAPESVEIHAPTCRDVDITRGEDVRVSVAAWRPDWIVNAAAYTAVDRAESQPERAYAVNRDGPEHLARAAQEARARLLHVSTDFVFDGESARPYLPADPCVPRSVYGASKLAGEQRVTRILDSEALIVRTAWLYSDSGENFVRTMLRLMVRGEPLRVVSDQVGTPTWARGLALALWTMIDEDVRGIRHWTDAGVASWYDFAVAIQEEALALGILSSSVDVRPVPTCEYPRPARRPSYSVLDKSATWEIEGLAPRHWRVMLRSMLREAGDGLVPLDPEMPARSASDER